MTDVQRVPQARRLTMAVFKGPATRLEEVDAAAARVNRLWQRAGYSARFAIGWELESLAMLRSLITAPTWKS